jgi:hypothetical protein
VNCLLTCYCEQEQTLFRINPLNTTSKARARPAESANLLLCLQSFNVILIISLHNKTKIEGEVKSMRYFYVLVGFYMGKFTF